MINGYVTYEELKLITGIPEYILKKLILLGLHTHEIAAIKGNGKSIKKDLFNLKEVESWLKIHIY